MRPGSGANGHERGFTYVGLLALVVLIGLLLARAGEVVATSVQREHEAELLWVGHQYRDAIGSYVAHNHSYPATLQELLGTTAAVSSDTSGADPAGPAVASGVLGTQGFRALRRLYPDPMTASANWVTVPSPDGHIMGVASTSTRVPIKRAGFDDEDVDFDKAETYAGWLFIYAPQVSARARRLQ